MSTEEPATVERLAAIIEQMKHDHRAEIARLRQLLPDAQREANRAAMEIERRATVIAREMDRKHDTWLLNRVLRNSKGLYRPASERLLAELRDMFNLEPKPRPKKRRKRT